jgi:hypothetical protein
MYVFLRYPTTKKGGVKRILEMTTENAPRNVPAVDLDNIRGVEEVDINKLIAIKNENGNDEKTLVELYWIMQERCGMDCIGDRILLVGVDSDTIDRIRNEPGNGGKSISELYSIMQGKKGIVEPSPLRFYSGSRGIRKEKR